MYEQFYGLARLPFRMAPDPRFLYFSKQHRTAFAYLQYTLVHDVAFCLISGEIGSGKTTLIRHLMKQLPTSISLGLISDTSGNIDEFGEWVSVAFDLPVEGSQAVNRKRLREFLHAEHEAGRRPLLIVDEAQNLGKRNLEELRLLSNISSGDDVLLQVMLVGQPELRQIIADEGMRQVAQRVSIQFHLGVLDVEDTIEYVRHRMKAAGATEEIFTASALRLLHTHTQGVPRLINRLGDHALAFGFGIGEKIITAAAIAVVAAEMRREFE